MSKQDIEQRMVTTTKDVASLEVNGVLATVSVQETRRIHGWSGEAQAEDIVGYKIIVAGNVVYESESVL